MRVRFAAAVGLALGLSALGNAQPRQSESPRLPDKAALDRLNLRTEWAINLPIQWQRDSVTLAQIIDDQLFVQTRTGQFMAVDATNGRVQWSMTLGNGEFTNTYPVAANSRFVFVVNVTTLYAFHRYNGLSEFVTDIGTMPTAGLSADELRIYAVLATRPGYGGASRLEVYRLPGPIPIPVTAPLKGGADAAAAAARNNPVPNPVDLMIQRYPTSGVPRTETVDPEPVKRPTLNSLPPSGLSGTPTPSLAVVPSVNPPYTKESGVGTPSLGMLPSLKHPYRVRGTEGYSVQQTASLSTIPPSVAAALVLSDLRPKGVQPAKVLEVSLTDRILFPLLLTPLRAWAATDSELIIAVSIKERAREVTHRTSDPVSAKPAQANDKIGRAHV